MQINCQVVWIHNKYSKPTFLEELFFCLALLVNFEGIYFFDFLSFLCIHIKKDASLVHILLFSA